MNSSNFTNSKKTLKILVMNQGTGWVLLRRRGRKPLQYGLSDPGALRSFSSKFSLCSSIFYRLYSLNLQKYEDNIFLKTGSVSWVQLKSGTVTSISMTALKRQRLTYLTLC